MSYSEKVYQVCSLVLTGKTCFKTAPAHAFVKWPFIGGSDPLMAGADMNMKLPINFWRPKDESENTYEHKGGIILVHNYGEDQFPDMDSFSLNKNFSDSDPLLAD